MGFRLHPLFLFFHILFAIVWVGGLFFIGWSAVSAYKHMPYKEQRLLLRRLMKWFHLPLLCAGIGVIVTGILLGTLSGPIRDWKSIWHSTFGHLWATAFITGALSLTWGAWIGYRHALKLLGNEPLWANADHGAKKTLHKALLRLLLIEAIEPAGILVLIIIMVFL
jgi:putative copper export protein